MATKLEVWNSVQSILQAQIGKKLTSEVVAQIEDLLAPKSGGGVSINPPKMIDDVMHYWCRFHERYEADVDMVMSQGKSKGYCKASISKWNKVNSQIKKLESQAVGAIVNDKLEEAQKLSQEAKALKETLNLPASYDYDLDWKMFNGQLEQ